MKISLYFVTAFVVLITRTESARILATIFTPSYSHQVTFRPLWRELAKRGHEIVLLTTDPMREPELNNLKEIDLKGSYEVMEQHGASEVISNARGRGNKELLDTYMTALSKTADWQLSQPEVQDLIRNESEHFDLIMVEMMFPTHLGFVDSDMISLPVNLSPSKSVPTQAMGVVLLLVFAVVPILMQTECARILGIIPTASYSHQAPFQPFWRQLSLRGHQVTVMTTNPANDPSLTNLTEIDLSFTYEIYSKYNFTEFVSDDTNSFLKIAQTMKTMLNEAGDFQFGHPQVQNLIHNKGVTFDLVIVEAQLPAMMSFSWRFNCPMIGIASLDSGMQYHLAMGNPTHPIVNPDLNLPVEDAEDMTFKERMSSFVYHFGYTRYLYDHAYPNLQVKLRTIFGEDLPDLLQLHDNMAMLFINTHPIFHSIRPLNPNTIPIGGGIHLRKPEPLAEEIQSQLDNAKEGAIYVSFGTNVNARMVNSMITVILEALGELPYRVLLKADLKLEKTPRNVVTHKWLPQQDILRHPNLKLFVTQGGLQSLQEAVYNAVPLVGIPFLGDQIANVNRMVKKGYGLKLNKNDVTRESIKRVVLEVMNNPKYSEKVRELSAIYREEEMPSLEKAIWWTEYVIRHKGGRHLRSVAVDMPSWKYFMLDVIGFLLSVLVLFTFTCYRITKYVSRLCVKANSKLKVQ